MYFFGLTKQFRVVRFLISGLFWKILDAGQTIPVPLACETSALPFELHHRWGNCQCNSWTEFSIAYRSNFGFVDAGHHSMCFSHASRLPFWLSCLATGVQRSYLCQREFYDSLFSRVETYPLTSFWGRPLRFGAAITFSARSVLFPMLPFAFWTYISIAFFGIIKQLPVVRFFSGLFWKVLDAGHWSLFFRNGNRHSILWATSRLRKRGAYDIWSLSSGNAKVERILPFHIVLKLALLMRVINYCASHMPIACPFDWAASLLRPQRAKWIGEWSLLNKPVE